MSILFDRLITPRFNIDFKGESEGVVDEETEALDALSRIGTNRLAHPWFGQYDDIRQILSDNIIKEMMAEEDRKFISSMNSMLP